MNEIKAIETSYKGYRFRSRLEARWAVFFDALGVVYEYERQGFDLGEAGPYLPDFWLPLHRIWVEVKGQVPTEDEREKAAALARQTEWPALIMSGQIGGEVNREFGWWEASYDAEVHLGSPGLYARHCLASAGRRPGSARTGLSGLGPDWYESWSLLDFVLSKGATITATGSIEQLMESVVEADKSYYRRTYGKEHFDYRYGWWHKPSCPIVRIDNSVQFPKFELDCTGAGFCHPTDDVRSAMDAARSARFEHGESGARK